MRGLVDTLVGEDKQLGQQGSHSFAGSPGVNAAVVAKLTNQLSASVPGGWYIGGMVAGEAIGIVKATLLISGLGLFLFGRGLGFSDAFGGLGNKLP